MSDDVTQRVVFVVVLQSADVESMEEKVRKMIDDDLHVSVTAVETQRPPSSRYPSPLPPQAHNDITSVNKDLELVVFVPIIVNVTIRRSYCCLKNRISCTVCW